MSLKAVFLLLATVYIVSRTSYVFASFKPTTNWIIVPANMGTVGDGDKNNMDYSVVTSQSSYFIQTNEVPNVTDSYVFPKKVSISESKRKRNEHSTKRKESYDKETTSELKELNLSVSFWYKKFRHVIKLLRTYLSEENDILAEQGRKLKYKKFLLPLLMAYKLKFFTLIPVFIGGLILLTGSTGLAGFFFALFAAVISLKTDAKYTFHQ